MLVAAVIGFAMTASAEKNVKPFVVPELREWEGAEGEFVFAKNTRLVCVDNSEQSAAVAEQFADDYMKMFGMRLRVVKGRPSAGDLVMSLVDDDRLGNEGYAIVIGDKVEVSATTFRGLMWATRTLLQIAEQSDGRLPNGKIVDYPDYEMRSFMLDCGRKYIPISFLHDYVDFMAYHKMNTFHIHLNDNAFHKFFNNDWSKTPSGFRLESDFFPGLTSRDGYYTKQEFIDLQKHAERMGVEIIPEFDMPAHSLAFVHYRPELGSDKYGLDHLDLFKEETYSFVDSLYMEYLGGEEPVFRGPRFHVGTDEYSNKDSLVVEKFRYFTDYCIRTAEKYGKQVCMWGALSHAEGKTPVKVENVIVYEWNTKFANPTEMIRLGYDVVSIPEFPMYIVPAAGYYYDYLNCRDIYENWTPAVIIDHKFEEKHPQIKGGSFAVWNDHAGNGISTKDIHYRVHPAMQAMAVKMWTGRSVELPYEEYDGKRLSVSDAPGVNIAGRYSGEKRTVVDMPAVKPSQNLSRKTGVKEIGFEYTVSFDIEYDPADGKGTELFASRDAVFYLADPVNGMLGFERDGYLNTFRYSFFPGEKAKVTICGNKEKTSLYIDGRHVETLDKQSLFRGKDGRDRMFYVRTLVFPLEMTGEFRSKVTDLKVMNHMAEN